MKNLTFGQRLAQIRKDAGLTQALLAEKLNISVAMMKYYELRAKNPNLEIIRKLSNILDISVDTLLLDQKSIHPGPESELQKRFNRISKLSRKRQHKIINIIDAVITE